MKYILENLNYWLSLNTAHSFDILVEVINADINIEIEEINDYS